MYFYQLITKGAHVYTFVRQTSPNFAGIYSTRKPSYILKNHAKFYPKITQNFSKNFPFYTPNFTHFFQIFTLQKHPKILHLYNQTFPITPTLLSIFCFSHITPNYINLS